MEPDPSTICVEVSFIRQQRNAIVKFDKLQEDLIARKVLAPLGIKFKVDGRDYYKIANKVGNFRNLNIYDSIEMDHIVI